MSIEAFVMNYRDKEPVPLPFDAIRRIFDTPDTEWNDEHHYLHVRFTNPSDYVDIYCDDDAPDTNTTKGLMIARPIMHCDYLAGVFRRFKYCLDCNQTLIKTTPVVACGLADHAWMFAKCRIKLRD